MQHLNSKQPMLISACLIGEYCRYDGQNSVRSDLLALLQGEALIPVCPEIAGGLPTPRPPAEIRGEQVVRENGEIVTAQFMRGAEICLDAGLTGAAAQAILKSRSPACGCGKVYDGSFTGTLIEGDGVFTQILKAAGIKCFSDEDLMDNRVRP